MKKALIVVCSAAALGLAAVGVAGPTATAPEPVAPEVCARKMALDLTHRAPKAQDLADLASGAIDLPTLADRYLASPEFSQVVFNWYRQQFPPTKLTPAGTDTEEPARIARHVVVDDRDYREILTGAYTVDANGAEVQKADGAGVISTRHYLSAYQGNLRRNWAGRFQREWTGIFLKSVTLPAGAPVDTSRDGIAANPECAGCHVHPIYGLDFLARFVDCYTADGVRDPACTDSTDAMFLTVRGRGLHDLGQLTTDSKEFKAQAVSFFFSKLFGRPIAKGEEAYYVDAEKAFEAAGFHAKALLKHLVTSPAYCAR